MLKEILTSPFVDPEHKPVGVGLLALIHNSLNGLIEGYFVISCNGVVIACLIIKGGCEICFM